MSKHHHKAALFNGNADIAQRKGLHFPLVRRIGERQIFCFDHIHEADTSFDYNLIQRSPVKTAVEIFRPQHVDNSVGVHL